MKENSSSNGVSLAVSCVLVNFAVKSLVSASGYTFRNISYMNIIYQEYCPAAYYVKTGSKRCPEAFDHIVLSPHLGLECFRTNLGKW